MYIFNTQSRKPLYQQLYTALKEDIIENHKVGDKLPSIRKIVSLYNLSKNTVQSAYSQLYAEGYIESRPKSGYYVSELFFDSFKGSEDSTPKKKEIKDNYKYDFFPAQLHRDDFPLKLWKRLFSKVVNDNVDFGAYSEGQGILELREQIAKYLQNSRGVVCKVENIIITHGFIDSMELLAKLSQERYSSFAQEIPGYHIAHKIFYSFGYEVKGVNVDKNGIEINQLKKNKSQIVYITPTHQYPTGVTMPIASRQKLISHMQSIDGLIIEDDYDSELSYYNRPIPSLQGLDKHECVAYLGTFSKALSPAIRVGYMVVPSWFMKIYQSSYDSHFSSVSLMTQLTLEKFMRDGHWERHIRRIRMINKKKHQTMKKALIKHLNNSCTIIAEGAGLAILIVPNKPSFDWDKLKELSQEQGIAVYFSKERSGAKLDAVRMGFGGFRIDEIEKAVHAFGVIWKEVYSKNTPCGNS